MSVCTEELGRKSTIEWVTCNGFSVKHHFPPWNIIVRLLRGTVGAAGMTPTKQDQNGGTCGQAVSKGLPCPPHSSPRQSDASMYPLVHYLYSSSGFCVRQMHETGAPEKCSCNRQLVLLLGIETTVVFWPENFLAVLLKNLSVTIFTFYIGSITDFICNIYI